MATLRLECLCCGQIRVASDSEHRRLDGGECPRCRYVGWANSSELAESVRRALRERPLIRRRLRLI